MFEFFNVQGLTMSDLMLYGRATSEGDQCKALVQFRYITDGPGSAGNTIRNTVFRDAQVGIRCGAAESEGLNACMYFETVTFKDCDIGFQVNNSNGLNYLFDNLFASGCDVILDFPFGGSVNVQGMGCTDCGNDETRYAIEFGAGGPNVGPSVISAFRYENVSKLLRVAGDHRLICDGWGQATEEPDPPEPPAAFIKLSRGGTVFRNCRWQFTIYHILEFGAPSGSDYCTVRFDHCLFPYAAISGDPDLFPVSNVILNPSQANCAFDFHRCDGPGHKPLPDATSGDWN